MSTVILQIQDNLARIILNRPEKRNAFNDIMIQELTTILYNLKNNPTITMVVLEGLGKSFCAGADLEWMRNMVHYTQAENYQDSLKLATMLNLLYTLPQITIAKVHGAIFGGGVGLVACCDLALAADDTTFCFSEVKLGLIPAVISPYILQALGARHTKYYFVTGERLSALKACELGLVAAITSYANLEATLLNLLQMLNTNSQIAIGKAKALLLSIQDKPLDQALIQQTAEYIAQIRMTPDAQQRLKSFLN